MIMVLLGPTYCPGWRTIIRVGQGEKSGGGVRGAGGVGISRGKPGLEPRPACLDLRFHA